MSDNKRKYTLNEQVWDTLTPELAYWLGFLYGAGNCTQENKVRLQIQWGDREHLFAFRNFIGSENRPIKEIITDRCHNASIEFRSWKVHNIIKKYELTKVKAHRGRLHISLLHPDVVRDFIRGIFDADGSFYYGGTHKNYLYAEITGHMPLLSDIKNVLIEAKVLNQTKHITRNGSIFRLRFAKEATLKLIEYLYGGNPLYKLSRKYSMVKHYLDRLNEVTTKVEATVETYHRPVETFNAGKQGEFEERQHFVEPGCSCCK